jgi:hypothetical protein
MRHLTSPLPCIARHDCRREEFRPIAHRHLSSRPLAAQLAGSAPKLQRRVAACCPHQSGSAFLLPRQADVALPFPTCDQCQHNRSEEQGGDDSPLQGAAAWSGSTPKRTSTHSRVMTVNMASPAANVARATSTQNRMCGFTVFGPFIRRYCPAVPDLTRSACCCLAKPIFFVQ